MKDMEQVFVELSAPFRPDQIHWRIGVKMKDKPRAMALAYLDARDVMDRLDGVCGQGNWMSDFEFSHPMVMSNSKGDEVVHAKVCCTISLRVTHDDSSSTWVRKSDVAGETDIEGEKGGASDAFKRAAVHLGIGRYLYRLDSPWVDTTGSGRGVKIKPGQEDKLAAVLAATQDGAPPPSQAPKAAPPESGPAKFLDVEQKKQLYGTNFKALELFHDKKEIETFNNDTKFAPLNFACAQVGVTRLDDAYLDQFEPIKEGMREWVREKRARDNEDDIHNDEKKEVAPDPKSQQEADDQDRDAREREQEDAFE